MPDYSKLPRLEVADLDSPFDEALILVNGHEEETIRIECEGAGHLAAAIVRLVNEARRRGVLPPPDETQSPYLAGPARLALIEPGAS